MSEDGNDIEHESNISMKFGIIFVIIVVVFAFIVFTAMSQNKAYQDNSRARYVRAKQLAMLHEFYPRTQVVFNTPKNMDEFVKQQFNREITKAQWGIDENMTIREARSTYLMYETYAQYIGMGLLDWVCDGGSSPGVLD